MEYSCIRDRIFVVFVLAITFCMLPLDCVADNYRWTNNKNTKNESMGGIVGEGTYIQIGVYIAPSAMVQPASRSAVMGGLTPRLAAMAD